MKPQYPWPQWDQIFIDPLSVESEVAQRLLKIYPNQCQVGVPKDKIEGELTANQFTQSKKQLFVTPHKGHFFKKCPGNHKGLACCNYFVLNLGFQCDMDCSYCYLQSFINSNYLTIYSNIDQAIEELQSSYDELGDQPVRVGTGEVIDSLSLDPLTLYSKKLMSFFSSKPHWKLEFKTKSHFIEQFINEPHCGNIIVSWSINPPLVIQSEEHKTASFDQRIAAALECRKKGFPVAFHIDPMIWHPQWKESYGFLVDTISKNFSPQDIPYISIGALRFQPEQSHIMRERFGLSSMVTQGETFPSQDGKLRYDHKLRQEMFRFVRDRFTSTDSLWKIFLCMETPETWVSSFGSSPHRQPQIKELFQPIR